MGLLAEDAHVQVDPTRIQGGQIAEWISELGFRATVRETTSDSSVQAPTGRRRGQRPRLTRTRSARDVVWIIGQAVRNTHERRATYALPTVADVDIALRHVREQAGVRKAEADGTDVTLVHVTFDDQLTGVRTLRNSLHSVGALAQLRPSNVQAQRVRVPPPPASRYAVILSSAHFVAAAAARLTHGARWGCACRSHS